MKQWRWIKILGMLGALFLLVEGAHALTALSNLGVTPVGTACVGGAARKADGFTTDGGGPYTLDAVTYNIYDANASYTLWLHADGGGQPGAAIGTLGSITLGGTSSYREYTFTPASPFALSNNTTYWLVPQIVTVNCTQSIAPVGSVPTGQFTYVGPLLTLDSGATWGATSQPSIFAVEVSVVPPDAPDDAGPLGILDGRINAYDLAPPTVLYGADYGSGAQGLTVYSPHGDLLMVVTPDEIAAVDACPAQNTLIATSPAHGITLWRLAGSCQFQLIAPTGEPGKVYIIIFPALHPAGGYTSYETWLS